MKYQALKFVAILLIPLVLIGQTPISSNQFEVAPNSTNSTVGTQRFLDLTSHYVAFKACTSISTNVTWQWPCADGSPGYLIQTDGAGHLSFVSAAAASVANGFQVIGSSTVSPPVTTMGWQAWYRTSDYSTNWLSYDNANTLSSINIGASTINLIGAPIVSAVGAASTPFTLIGAAATNGGIVLQPGNVASQSTVFINTQRLDQAGLTIGTPSGTTTSNAFQINNFGGSPFFKVIGATDAGCPGCVVSGSLFSNTNLTYNIGSSGNRWLKLWTQDADFSGTITQASGTAPWVKKAGDQWSGAMTFSTVGTLDLGTKTNPGGATYWKTAVGSEKFEIHDSAGSDLNVGSFSMSSTVTAATKELYFKDSANVTFLTLSRQFVGVTASRAFFNSDIDLTPTGTFDLGADAAPRDIVFTRNLRQGSTIRIDASGNAFFTSCSGCATGAAIANGYIVTDKTYVSPPNLTPGMQGWYNTTDHSGNMLVYDNASAFSALNLSLSSLNLKGIPVISAAGSSGPPLQFIGAAAGNGNILHSPGNVAGNASSVFAAGRSDAPVVLITTPAGTTTSNSIEVDNNAGAAKWKVISPGDAGCPACMVSGDIFGQVNLTNNIGSSGNRWLKLWVGDIDASGTTPWVKKSGDQWSGAMTFSTIGTIDLGTKTNPGGNTYWLGAVGSEKFEVHDQSGADLNVGSFSIRASVNAATKEIYFNDSTNTAMLTLSREFIGATQSRAYFNMDINLTPTGTFDIGHDFAPRDIFFTRNLVQGATTRIDSAGVAHFTGCIGCGGGVTNGFFVTDKTDVNPPSSVRGLQVWFNLSDNSTNMLSQDNTAAPSPLNITTSSLNLFGTPSIRGPSTGTAPLQLFGPTASATGNIVLTPGTVSTTNSSVVIQQGRTDQPGLYITEPSVGQVAPTFAMRNSAAVTKYFIQGDSDTSCPNCVNSATQLPLTDATYPLGTQAKRWSNVSAANGQFGLPIVGFTPANTYVQITQNGQAILDIDSIGGLSAILLRGSAGSYPSPSPTLNGQGMGGISARGYDGASGDGWSTSTSTSISFVANENFSSGHHGGYLQFNTATPGANQVGRMILNEVGLIPLLSGESIGSAAAPFDLFIRNFSCTGIGCPSAGGSFLPLSGGNMTGDITANGTNLGSATNYFNNGIHSGTVEGGRFRAILGVPNSITDYFDFTTTGLHTFRLQNSSSTILLNIDDSHSTFTNTQFQWTGDLAPNVSNFGNVGLLTRPWQSMVANAILANTNLTLNGGVFTLLAGSTIVPPVGSVLNGTSTCPSGQHVNQIVMSQGLVTGISCN